MLYIIVKLMIQSINQSINQCTKKCTSVSIGKQIRCGMYTGQPTNTYVYSSSKT